MPKVFRVGALSGHFGVAFWYMRVILDHFGITSGPLCGNFGYIKVLLTKTLIFPIYFNDFISSSCHFGIDLGLFGGHFGIIFGIWGDFGALSEQI